MNKNKHIKHTGGFGMLELMVILTLLSSVGIIYFLTPNSHDAQQYQEQRASLKLADQHLLAYIGLHGRLPCPDVNDDGFEDCGTSSEGNDKVNKVGSFPYKTVGLGDSDGFMPREIPLRYGVYRNEDDTKEFHSLVNASGTTLEEVIQEKTVDEDGNELTPEIRKPLVDDNGQPLTFFLKPHDADLAQAKNRSQPIDHEGNLIFYQVDQITSAHEKFNNANTLDLCTALDNALASSEDNPNEVHIRYEATGIKNVAYALATVGLRDSDGDQSLFDGANGQTGVGFEASFRERELGAYDDLVISRGINEVRNLLSCDLVTSSVNHTATAVSAHYDVRDFYQEIVDNAELAKLTAQIGTSVSTANQYHSIADSTVSAWEVTKGALATTGSAIWCSIFVAKECVLLPVRIAGSVVGVSGVILSAATVVDSHIALRADKKAREATRTAYKLAADGLDGFGSEDITWDERIEEIQLDIATTEQELFGIDLGGTLPDYFKEEIYPEIDLKDTYSVFAQTTCSQYWDKSYDDNNDDEDQGSTCYRLSKALDEYEGDLKDINTRAGQIETDLNDSYADWSKEFNDGDSELIAHEQKIYQFAQQTNDFFGFFAGIRNEELRVEDLQEAHDQAASECASCADIQPGEFEEVVTVIDPETGEEKQETVTYQVSACEYSETNPSKYKQCELEDLLYLELDAIKKEPGGYYDLVNQLWSTNPSDNGTPGKERYDMVKSARDFEYSVGPAGNPYLCHNRAKCDLYDYVDNLYAGSRNWYKKDWDYREHIQYQALINEEFVEVSFYAVLDVETQLYELHQSLKAAQCGKAGGFWMINESTSVSPDSSADAGYYCNYDGDPKEGSEANKTEGPVNILSEIDQQAVLEHVADK